MSLQRYLHLLLIDETNNLEYVNIKQKIVIDKPQPKRIIGMPPLKGNTNSNNENFKINYDNDLYNFEKRIIDDNTTIRVMRTLCEHIKYLIIVSSFFHQIIDNN